MSRPASRLLVLVGFVAGCQVIHGIAQSTCRFRPFQTETELGAAEVASILDEQGVESLDELPCPRRCLAATLTAERSCDPDDGDACGDAFDASYLVGHADSFESCAVESLDGQSSMGGRGLPARVICIGESNAHCQA